MKSMRLKIPSIMLLTVISGLVVIVLMPERSFAAALATLLAASLQVCLLNLVFIFEQSASIVAIHRHPMRIGKRNSYYIYAALALSPTLAMLAWWLPFVAIALISAINASSLYSLIMLNYKRKSWRRDLNQEYLATPPAVLAYMAGDAASAYQINQWLPVFERLPFKIAVVLRNRDLENGMDATKLDLYFARAHNDIEFLFANGPKVILYPVNSQLNVHALRHFKTQHYFINHGESDKFVNQNKLTMAYDKLLVAGPLAERRLIDAGLPVRPGQVVHVGRPQAEVFLHRATSTAAAPRRILYAPTWEGYSSAADYSSVEAIGETIIQELVAGGRHEIIFKPHPFTGRISAEKRASVARIKELCRSAGAKVLTNSDSLYDAMNWSDIIICDISSVLNDYLMTDKPIIMCVTESLAKTDVYAEFPSSRAAYILRESSDLITILADIEGEDSLAATRAEVRRECFGDGSAMERFTAALVQGLER